MMVLTQRTVLQHAQPIALQASMHGKQLREMGNQSVQDKLY
jgi:hypothetical protein